MNVAIVYDRVTKWGGAERVLLALHKIWPDAPLYTAVYDKKRAAWANVLKVHTSFLQKIPLAKNMHEVLPWATPMAFESFTFDEYDVVISVTSAEAKYIITKPQTVHICYCLTPTRYLWSGYDEYQQQPGLGFLSPIVRWVHKRMAPQLKQWDRVAASRPDYYVAISKRVAQRIQAYYEKKPLAVVYPPVDTKMFSGMAAQPSKLKEPYFLTVTRLVGYKRVDILIKAFNELKWRLVVVGNGRDKARLRRMAGDTILFMEDLSDSDLAHWYANCQGFVYAADEDFGIAAIEALASGKPVISYRQSAVAEAVTPGKTGELFDHQSVSSLVGTLKTFQNRWYDSALCKKTAERFSEARFRREMKETVSSVYNTV